MKEDMELPIMLINSSSMLCFSLSYGLVTMVNIMNFLQPGSDLKKL